MNSFYYLSLCGISAIGVSNLVVSAKAKPLADDIVGEQYETCDVEIYPLSAIATCKVEDPTLSFEEKVRYCTAQMRPENPLHRK
jgi:hypothetical protein